MADESFQDKTEQATPKKREDSRRKGKVARSQEVGSAAVIGTGLVALNGLGPWMLDRLSRICTGFFTNAHTISLTPMGFPTLAADVAVAVATLMLPFVAILFVIGLGVNVAQTGFLFAPEALTPNWGRLDPIAGVKRVFSLRGAMESAKALAKVSAVCAVAALSLRGEFDRVSSLIWGGLGEIYADIWAITFASALRIVVLLIVLAVIDVVFQRWQFAKDLRMSQQEVKEEHRQQEGDPLIKARIRSLQKERARRRMMSDVPTADVVVTNPVHVAVALKYDAGSMEAPRVIAKGMNLIAARIREIAAEHGVPVVENPPLARAINKSVKLGGVIPVSLYGAVAEILALAYRLKGRVS